MLDKHCDLLMSLIDLHFHKKEIQKELMLISDEIQSDENFEEFVRTTWRLCAQTDGADL